VGLGAYWGAPRCLEALADIALNTGQLQSAAQLFSAADHWRLEMESPLSPAEREAYQTALGKLRNQLASDSFAAEWETGRALKFEAIIQMASEITASGQQGIC
jgi:hypothetical protein